MVEHKIEANVSRKIAFLQLLMSIIVCMGHIGFGGNWEPRSVADGQIYYFYQWLISELTGISVQLYMLMSAFLLYYNCDRHNILEKFSRRIYSLVIPYLAWNVVYAMYYCLIEKRDIFNIGTLYQGLLVEPWDGPLWFVLALIAFLPLIFVLGPAKKWWQSVFVIICIMLFLRYVEWNNIPVTNWFCSKWNANGQLYFSGVLLARICPKVVCETKYNGTKMAIGGMFVLVLELAQRWNDWPLPSCLLVVLPFLCAVALWMSVPTALAEKALSNKRIKWISKKSFLIFASHVLIGKIVIRGIVVPLVYAGRVFAGYQAAIIMLATQICVFICLFVFLYIFEKVFPRKVQSIFAGGRGDYK